MTTDPFQTTSPQICASILSANFAKLAAEIDEVLSGGADFIHMDIMDAHFVPNLSFGPPVIKSIRPTTTAYFDAHLMISDPLRYAPAMVKAGAQNLTLHIETLADPAAALREVRKLGCTVGLTLRPATPAETIYPYLELIDMVLVMSVVPGFSGQMFMPEVLPKAREIKKRLTSNQRLQIDGGMNPQTIVQARDAGVDWFVVASAIFDQPDRAAAIAELRSLLQ